MRMPSYAGFDRNKVASAVVPIFCLSMLIGSGCVKDPVTGKRTFSMVDEEQEIRIGTEEDAKVVAAIGLYQDEKLAVHMDQIGQALAATSHRPDLKYTFQILDTPVLNAFALPGGFVYLTRGTLAHLNSSDELAGVMGHEVGHIVGRHSAEQISRQVVASGFGLFNVVSAIAPLVGGLISAPSQLLMRSYSRDQERESDSLGVEYATKLGYDAHELANFFRLIEQITEEEGGGLPSFLSTHPAPGDRVEEVNSLADEWQAKLHFESGKVDTAAYLKLIDGIVFGVDPRQGYEEGGMFYHPNLAFQFAVPLGWKLANAPHAVQIISADEKAVAVLVINDASTPRGAATRFVDKAKVEVTADREIRSHGLPVYVVESRSIRDDLKIISYFIALDEKVFSFHGLARTRDYGRHRTVLVGSLDSFQRAGDPAVLGKKPLRVRLRVVEKSGSLEEFARDSGVTADLLPDVARLNGRGLGDLVEGGETIKIIVE